MRINRLFLLNASYGETTVAIRSVPAAGPLSYAFPCLCAKPSYGGLASLPQCPALLGLIAIPGLCPCILGSHMNLLMCPHGGRKPKFMVSFVLGNSLNMPQFTGSSSAAASPAGSKQVLQPYAFSQRSGAATLLGF